MIKKTATFFVLIVLAHLTACRRPAEPEPALSVVAHTDLSLTPTVIALPEVPTPPTRDQPPFTFDWETATVMPLPAGQVPIPVPWSNAANRAFDESVRNDYHRADGWELVSSHFTQTSSPSSHVFMLYNRYRGVLRLYTYLPAGTQRIQEYNALAHTLSLAGSARLPLLNFADQAVVDVEGTSPFASTIEAHPPRDRTWYAIEYELAFDPNVAGQRFETLALTHRIAFTTTESVRLRDQTSATLPVPLRREGVDWALPGFPSGSRPLRLLISNSEVIDRLASALGSGADSLRQSLAQRRAGGLTSGTLSAGGTAPGSQLIWETVGQVTLANNGQTALFMNMTSALPGYDNTQTVGIAPQYNEAPGVFNLARRPVVQVRQRATGLYRYLYTLKVPSVEYLFNPALTRVARVENLRQELILTDANSAAPTRFFGTSVEASRPLNVEGVRVSFDVVPHAGGPITHHIKTFRAQEQND